MRKEKEQSLNQAYQEFIEIGLNIRPIIDELKHLIDPKIMGFGTTEDERIFSSQEFFDLIKRQEEQATGIKLEHQIKPVHRRVLNGENSAIYVDDMIMRITTDSDQFEIKLRFSIVFEYQEKKWIVVHWHGSKPEEVKSEEDTWGIDIWKKKTEELEQIISEKTADLVEKNRELAIEAALEKVRAVAMGMKKPEDMLAICRIISEQLEKFGVEKIRNIQTAIIDEEKGIYLCYQYFTYYDKEAVERTEYLKNPVEHGMVKQMLASKDGHFTGTISGKELEEFREHRKAENHFPDPLLEDSDEISHCFLSIGQGGLGLTLYQQLDTSTLNLFKRFHQVFSLAYRRFQDIQKAEARAREVEIDLALERVRAQTMAMHSSEDVGKCILKMFAELTALGVDERTRFGIGILNHENENNQLWTARKNGDEVNLHVGNINMDWHPMLIKARQAWLQQVPFHKYILEGEDLLDYYRMLNTAPEYKIQIPLETLPKKEIQHCFIFEHGFFYAFCPEEFDSEITSIAQRFSSQFEQTFRRYLDLQQAEAQAREAKIEAALERVRSKSLAMHQTSELQSVIHTVHEELVKLGLSIHGGSFIVINSEIDHELKCWGAGGTAETSQVVQIPRFEKPFYTDLLEGIKRGPGFFTEEFTAEEKNEYFEFLFKHEPWARLSSKEKKQRLEGKKPYFRSCTVSSNTSIFIINHEGVPFSEEDNAILKRFGRVFEQSYTRFLDLQKAEEQAREAQIETALERVRSRTIAMQSSNELSEAATEMFSQIKGLGLNPWSCGFNIFNEDKTVISQWVSSGDGRPIKPFDTPTTEGIFKRIVEDSEKEISLRIEKMEGKKLEDTYTYMASLPILDKIFEELDKAGIELPKYQVDHAAYFNYGYLMFITFDEVPEFHSIFKRFAKVFEQTYTRFLDLKKAESQAREAQIEAALERVRARAMAMHSSKELEEVALELRIQMGKLGQEDLEVCAIHLYEEDEDYFESWGAVRAPGMEEKLFQGMAKFPKSGIKIVDEMMAHYYAGDKDYVLVNDGEKGQEWLLAMKKYSPQAYAMLSKKIESIPTEEIIAYWSISDFKGGALVMVTYTQPDESSLNLLRRAANVFQLAYRRYLDLQKAEAQARESQIEAALERVRSRTMGMQKAEELGDVATLLFNELNTLVDNLWTCGFVLCEKDRQEDEWWLSADNGLIDPFFLPNVGDYTHESLYEGWKKGESYRTVTLEGPQLQEHYDWLLQIPIAVQIFEEMEGSGIPRPTWQRLHAAYFKTGYLVIITEVPCEEEDIFKRFAQVFDLTYTRFLDLQKAENQAQEAQIEAALEKVRSRSLAMQDPEELTEVAQLLREEMGNLGVEELETSSIYIHEESNGLTQCWFTIKNSQKPARSVSDQMVLDLQDTWVGNQMLRFYRSKEKKTSILMKGEQRVEWIRYCESKSELLGKSRFYGETIPERTYHLYKFSNGFLGAASPGPISEESWDLMRRATAVFSFAFTRFLDLQRAQASAKEARRQASLDRVRADISSMRTAADLDKITPLLFKELTTLDIPFIRCGVFIINEKAKIVEAYLSSPEGKSLGVLHLPFDASELTFQTVEAWRKGEVYRQHWGKGDFLNWIQQIMEKDLIQDEKTYQGAAAPPESLNLHFVPFTQGMLYVGSTETLSEDEIDLIRSLSEAFAIAYSRYEDFVKLEQAKAEIESAMSELKATQTQLVQQEKLASLGQLTAGIAHEIKNPLNFVNNFSEVSNELIDEAFEELEKLVDSEEKEEIIAILEDVKGNLSKVQEHGKRANGIVTSMLQHSRGGDGKMEPTDLNALLKEYVNLSFHGMRAAKNPINVDIELKFDEKIGKVNLVSEDFSRVIVNLCNNAFDAMRLKTNDESSNYQPKLTISTKIEKNQVTIEVEDNGPGIPDEIKDKILQPFFTTKKGTEGTGLGLSITNDIVKAHGGRLDVESNHDGSKFVISLPQ